MATDEIGPQVAKVAAEAASSMLERLLQHYGAPFTAVVLLQPEHFAAENPKAVIVAATRLDSQPDAKHIGAMLEGAYEQVLSEPPNERFSHPIRG